MGQMHHFKLPNPIDWHLIMGYVYVSRENDALEICETVSELANKFYVWGEISSFWDIEEGSSYCPPYPQRRHG